MRLQVITTIFLLASTGTVSVGLRRYQANLPGTIVKEALGPSSMDKRSPDSRSLQPRWENPYTDSDSDEFLCVLSIHGREDKTAASTDCEEAMSKLKADPGYWSCRDWDGAAMEEIYSFGSCHVRIAKVSGDDSVRIGNFDIFSMLSTSLHMYSGMVGGKNMTGASGSTWCDNHDLTWEVGA